MDKGQFAELSGAVHRTNGLLAELIEIMRPVMKAIEQEALVNATMGKALLGNRDAFLGPAGIQDGPTASSPDSDQSPQEGAEFASTGASTEQVDEGQNATGVAFEMRSRGEQLDDTYREIESRWFVGGDGKSYFIRGTSADDPDRRATQHEKAAIDYQRSKSRKRGTELPRDDRQLR